LTIYSPAANMIYWVECMKNFRNAYKTIAPLMQMVSEKTELLNEQMTMLAEKQAELAEVKAKVAELMAGLAEIQAQADKKTDELEE
jgi:dynein heavy chain